MALSTSVGFSLSIVRRRSARALRACWRYLEDLMLGGPVQIAKASASATGTPTPCERPRPRRHALGRQEEK
jgi:hypothetical protein